jgi:NO-binding membrane sensor protein with MHYT domain
MTLPRLLIALAFGLAAMAPVVAVTLLVLASTPKWRALGVRGLIIALTVGVGCFLLLFVGYHASSGAQTFEWYPALVTLGAGFSVGGAITCLWPATRRMLSNSTVERDARKDDARL